MQKNFPVTAESGIDIAAITASKQFTDWLASMDEQKFVVKSLHIQSVDMFGPKIGFIKFKADVTDKNGKFVPGIVFMRGGSVAILCVLTCEGKEYTLLTVQPRVPTGSFAFTEVPAGMLDGSGNFAGVAAKELDEEAGIKITAAELIDLGAANGYPNGVFLSPGGSDETIRIFLYRKTVTAEELADLNGRCTGLATESEQITLKAAPLADLLKCPDAKTITAYALYTAYVAAQAAATVAA